MMLTDLPMDRINMGALIASRAEVPTRTPSRAPTPADNPTEEERPQLSSQTTRGYPPPCGMGDDPFGLANILNNPMDEKPI